MTPLVSSVPPHPHSTLGSSPALTLGPGRGPIFAINFIRRETVPLRVRRLLAHAALGYLLANTILFIGFMGTALHSHIQSRKFQQRLQGKRPAPALVRTVRGETETLQEQAKEELAQLNAIMTQRRQRFPIGGKLAALTKTLPARTWVTSLSDVGENRTITLQAAYLVDPERPYDLPMKGWMEALRADPYFVQGLKRLDLGSSSRKTQGKAELVLFELVAEWQPGNR